jgi:undecaprenyl-diphosphatase
LLGWADQGLAFDVAVHAGTLAAVVIYFRQEVVELLRAWVGSWGGHHNRDSQLAWTLIVATIPAGLAGLLLGDWIEHHARSALVIAATTLFYAPLLLWSQRFARQSRDEYQVGWRSALILGCAQALALIPGTSRSGVTMTAALFLGLSRTAAARYSFLMSIPVIALAGGLESVKLIQTPDAFDLQAIAIGTVFLRLIERVGMMPFVIYRLLLGVALLIWFV